MGLSRYPYRRRLSSTRTPRSSPIRGTGLDMMPHLLEEARALRTERLGAFFLATPAIRNAKAIVRSTTPQPCSKSHLLRNVFQSADGVSSSRTQLRNPPGGALASPRSRLPQLGSKSLFNGAAGRAYQGNGRRARGGLRRPDREEKCGRCGPRTGWLRSTG